MSDFLPVPSQPAAWSIFANARDVYLAPWGADSNPGNTPGLPLLTMAAALTKVGAVGRILLMGNITAGVAASAAASISLPQNVQLRGLGSARCIVTLLGTGYGVDTNASGYWSDGNVRNLWLQNGDQITFPLHVANAQNMAELYDVIIGDTANAAHNGSAGACYLEDVVGNGNQPGFVRFHRCWFVGGAEVLKVMTGVTQIVFDFSGVDTDAKTTVAGVHVVANPAGGGKNCDIYLDHFKLETHAGPSATGAGALAGLGAGNVDAGAHTYVVTFLIGGIETNRSPAVGGGSVTVAIANPAVNGQVALSLLPLGNGVLAATTARKIYRSKAGVGTGGPFFLVGTINDNVTRTFTDNIADAALGAAYAPGPLDVPAYKVDVDTRLQGSIDARSGAVMTSTAVLWNPATLFQVRLSISALNYSSTWSAPNDGTAPAGVAMAENAMFAQFVAA